MNDFSRRRLFRAAGVLGVAGFAAGCTKAVAGSAVAVPHPTPPPKPDDLAKARRRGITVLVAAGNKPFSYTEDTGPGLTGEAVEVTKAAFAALGVSKVNFQTVDFAAAGPKLRVMRSAGAEPAMFAGGRLFNQQLCNEFDVVPDFVYLVAFGVAKGNPKNIKTFEDVVKGKLSVSAMAGDRLAQAIRAAGVSNMKLFPDPVTAARAVAEGHTDCFPFYDISLRQMVTDKVISGLDVTTGTMVPGATPMLAGFQFAKQDDTSIKDALSAQLASMRQSGQWLEIAGRFELTQGNEVPNGLTVEQVCH